MTALAGPFATPLTLGRRAFRLAEFTTVEHAHYIVGCIRRVDWSRLATRLEQPSSHGDPVSWWDVIAACNHADMVIPLLAGFYTDTNRAWSVDRAAALCEVFAARTDRDEHRRLYSAFASGFQHLANNAARVEMLARAPLPNRLFLFPTFNTSGRGF